MVLHTPQVIVARIVARHSAALGLVHGYLGLCVPDAYARWSDKYAPKDLEGTVLATSVRNLLLTLATNPVMQTSSLSMAKGPNCSARLFDDIGNRIRIRKRPMSMTTHMALPTTEAPIHTLFGEDLSAAPFEIVILWEPDLKTQTLNGAVVAAVADLDTPHKTAIYAELELPMALASPGRPPAMSDEDLLDDFDEYTEDEGTGSDDNPA
jgi:hypothetical protein